jgi:hypothetical protein
MNNNYKFDHEFYNFPAFPSCVTFSTSDALGHIRSFMKHFRGSGMSRNQLLTDVLPLVDPVFCLDLIQGWTVQLRQREDQNARF